MEVRQTRDGSFTLFSPERGEPFHSLEGALTETRHVFLRASGVEDRARLHLATSVLEVGFGAGLNFLVTADLFASSCTPLAYVALEKSLPPAALRRLLRYRDVVSCTDLADALDAFLVSLDERREGEHRFHYEGIHLVLRLGEATSALIEAKFFHAVYLDAFSPDVNPELWSPDFIRRLARGLRPGGFLSTYSVKGSFRRTLTAEGFLVTKIPGPPGKREITRAEIPLGESS